MRYTLIVLSVVVLAMTSCKKDDDGNVNCRVVKQVDNNTGVITTVTYKDGNPYRIEQSNGNSGQVTVNDDGQIVLYEIFDGSTRTAYVEIAYTGTGNILERRTFTRNLLGDFPQRFRDVYEYTGTEVTKVTNYDYDYSTTSINGYITYTYNAAGNVTEENQYGRDGSDNVILVRTITYEYDDNPSVAGDLGEYLNLFSENNVTVKNTTVFFPSGNSTTDSLEYNYNQYGYPTKVTTFLDDGSVTSYDVEYDCQ